MLRPGHPSPSFRWSCQRQRGGLNRPGTLDKQYMASRVLPPVPPAERNRRQGRLSGPCHERALRRPGPRSLPTRSPSGAPLLTTTRHRYAAGPICSVQFSVRYLGAPSPFVRDGVVMPLRDSCTSALSPALLSQASGLHILENSGSRRFRRNPHNHVAVPGAPPVIATPARRLWLAPGPSKSEGPFAELQRLPELPLDPPRDAMDFTLANRGRMGLELDRDRAQEVLPQTLVDRRRQLGQQRHFGVGKFERHGSLRMARRTIYRS
jgi:hypothetical protein